MSSQPSTPYLLVEEAVVRRNIRREADMARRCGVALRPHIKTHKIPELAAWQVQAGACGITVAKLGEAEAMVEGGIQDVFMAYPVIGGDKVERALRLARRCRLILAVDSLVGAEALSRAAVQQALPPVEVRLEIDTGLRRTGAPYEAALPLAKQVAALPGLRLTGIYTFRGAMLQGRPTDDLAAAGREEGELMAALADGLRAAGLDIQDVSVGSTPTAPYAAQVPGVTEVRPGTYLFHDRHLVDSGVCALEDCAAWLMVTVVSRPSEDLCIIDGGSKTFPTDVVEDGTYGQFQKPGLVLSRLSEEHGMVTVEGPYQPQIGEQLAVLPNHICTAVNLRNELYLRASDGSLRCLPVVARGRSS